MSVTRERKRRRENEKVRPANVTLELAPGQHDNAQHEQKNPGQQRGHDQVPVVYRIREPQSGCPDGDRDRANFAGRHRKRVAGRQGWKLHVETTPIEQIDQQRADRGKLEGLLIDVP
ncbi:MAG TPA: hypothetical protein VGP15_22830, partial [Burkholderiales bacterium]|nr:hypothetical protein [Burkholderiales bacterium]